MSRAVDYSKAERAHLDEVREMLAKVYRRDGRGSEGVEHATPLDALLAKEESITEDDYGVKVATLQGLIDWFFERADPAAVLQRVYVVARAVRPSVLRGMSGSDISVIFGQGRAAESARLLRLSGMITAAGFRHAAFRVQKSKTAREKMSRAQRGNRNRVGGKKRKEAI
jgi:hypothetical protein